MRFRVLELPFAAIGLIWNSVMSWAGGWFFLMAAEIFTVGERDFRLPGLGAYLQEAANQGNMEAIVWGVGTLILVIVVLDQLVWRPLLAWSDRFKLEMVEGDVPVTSWFYDALLNSRFVGRLYLNKLWRSVSDKIDTLSLRLFPMAAAGKAKKKAERPFLGYLGCSCGWIRPYLRGVSLPVKCSGSCRFRSGAQLPRVWLQLSGACHGGPGHNARLDGARRSGHRHKPEAGYDSCNHVVQVAASIPATALFPVFLLFILKLPGGLSLAAVFLMLLGTQWYMLFNIIAGASVIPQDLKYTAILMHMSGWERWRNLILPYTFSVYHNRRHCRRRRRLECQHRGRIRPFWRTVRCTPLASAR